MLRMTGVNRGLSVSLRLMVAASLLLLVSCGGGGSKKTTYKTGNDPFFADQWHLKNTAQFTSSTAGEDIDVVPVWTDGIKGEGVLVTVVDDGLQITHEDLAQNVAAGLSHDYQYGGTNPSPTSSSNYHGTEVGGVIAARDMNAVGVRGVATRASLAGYNLLYDQTAVSTADMQDAMIRNEAQVAVSNNSWGLAVDGLGEAEPPFDTLWQQGVAEGVANGRGGKGIVYVWAAGNGAWPPDSSDPYGGQDNSNYDYQANNRNVIAVCSVDGNGQQASYSENGANLWLCAPGGGDVMSGGNLYSLGLPTTDLMGNAGLNPGLLGDYSNTNYTRGFLGTSAAAPQVSGVVALMLEANPNLGWRDVRLILAETARKNDTTDGDWAVTSPTGSEPTYHINHKYGFGVVDAAAAVALAKTWTKVGAQSVVTKTKNSPVAIPDSDSTGVTQSVTVTNDLVVEYVEVDFSSDHIYPGDLEIVLTAPSGTKSTLAEPHYCISEFTGSPLFGSCMYQYNPWTFASVRDLGESSVGPWTLTVKDRQSSDGGSWNLTSWTLRIYGRAP
jgi:proprotein convertase subtilisin/kexin type 2